MKKLWRKYTERVDAMKMRERVIIFAAAAVLLVVFPYILWIESEFAKSRRLGREMVQRQGEMKSLQEQIGKLASARQADPDRLNRERLAAMRAQLAEVQSRIASEERKFTAPDKMKVVLEELLVKNQRVRLVSLRTLPVSSIAEERVPASAAPANPGAKPPPVAGRLIFKHGVELTVAGPYLDVLAYLSDLERLPTQLYWNALGMETSEYPAMTVKFTVFTMSLDRAWLNV